MARVTGRDLCIQSLSGQLSLCSLILAHGLLRVGEGLRTVLMVEVGTYIFSSNSHLQSILGPLYFL